MSHDALPGSRQATADLNAQIGLIVNHTNGQLEPSENVLLGRSPLVTPNKAVDPKHMILHSRLTPDRALELCYQMFSGLQLDRGRKFTGEKARQSENLASFAGTSSFDLQCQTSVTRSPDDARSTR